MLIEHSSPQLMAINFETPFQQVLQQQRPLLRSFNKEKKWQLWLSDRPMLKRSCQNNIHFPHNYWLMLQN